MSEIFISVGLRATIQSIFCGPCVGFEMKFYFGCGLWEPEKVAALVGIIVLQNHPQWTRGFSWFVGHGWDDRRKKGWITWGALLPKALRCTTSLVEVWKNDNGHRYRHKWQHNVEDWWLWMIGDACFVFVINNTNFNNHFKYLQSWMSCCMSIRIR